MYKCEGLTYKKLCNFNELNSKRHEFNSLNDDFFSSFSKKNLIQKIILLNDVKLLKYDNDYLGYIWVEKQEKNYYNIKSLGFANEDYAETAGMYLINDLKASCKFSYECENNGTNFDLLKKFGFVKEQGTIELIKELNEVYDLSYNEDISFETFVRGKHEKLRCEIQNDIFMNDNREPLTLDDIYFDIKEDYFWNEGSIFIKYKGEYIGYGQIILDDIIPTIVNFGIVKDLRNNGYGKLLLSYLISLVHKRNLSKVKIRVYSENYPAISLYINTGFVKVREYNKFSLSL